MMNELIEKQAVDIEGYGRVYPVFEYDSYDPNTDTYENLKIIKTGQEVYDEWLENKDKPAPPTPMEVLEGQVLASYEAQAELFETTLNQEEQILDSYFAQAELFEVILAQEETINELKNRLDALEGIAQPLV